MVVKPEKDYYGSLILGAVLVALWFLILVSDGLFSEETRGDWEGKTLSLLICVVCICIYISLIRYWIATGRTIVMHEEGCSVRFLWYRKEYRWDDFQIKAIENFSHAISYKTTYKKGAIFSTKPVHKPWWWDPISYSWHIHPLSFVFVNFTPDSRWDGMPKLCEVDEKIFMEKMQSWNVELGEIDFLKKRFPNRISKS